MPARPRLPRDTRPLAPGALVAVLALLVTLLVALAPGTATSAPARSGSGGTNPPTPGNFTGKGFDQCNAPSQQAMDAWLEHSPYRAVGIYISGASRFCREQPNLTPAWVSRQLASGWHLLPITLGPQANCQPRFPRYGANIDPTIRGKRANTYERAREQARNEADTAVAAARRLGIVPGSTLFYDLEGFDLNHSAKCRDSALWFLSSWSNRLHAHGYLSGVYSSAGSGMVVLDEARRNPPAGYVSPDMIWLARWNGRANTSATSYLSDEGWADHQRVKQYRGGHDERYGGVTINIDNNFLDVRTRPVPAAVPEPGATPPPPAPTPTPPATTAPEPSASLADPKCTRDSISRPGYRRTTPRRHRPQIVALQCLLKQQRFYPGMVAGHWNPRTTRALKAFQAEVGHRQRKAATRRDWIVLITAGSADTRLSRGDRGPDVIRIQRAMNAATKAKLKVTGRYNRATRRAVRHYKQRVLGRDGGTAGRLTWKALHRGKR